MTLKKNRIDKLLVETGLASSLKEAQALVMSGQVLANDVPVDKSGALISVEAELRLKGELKRFVSRGGEKLAHALELFECDVKNKLVLDVGASTGGFTDCLLQNGAQQVFALDVGYGQLAEKLRQDKRVLVFDRTHIKDLKLTDLPAKVDLVTIDVSFITCASILKFIPQFLCSQATVIILVKPQFELPANMLAKGGIVQAEKDQLQAVDKVLAAGKLLGWQLVGTSKSPIKGAKGNQEYLVVFRA